MQRKRYRPPTGRKVLSGNQTRAGLDARDPYFSAISNRWDASLNKAFRDIGPPDRGI